MKALLVIYALGVIGWIGLVHGHAPEVAKRRQLRVAFASLIWPVLLVFATGEMLGKWARK